MTTIWFPALLVTIVCLLLFQLRRESLIDSTVFSLEQKGALRVAPYVRQPFLVPPELLQLKIDEYRREFTDEAMTMRLS